MSTSTSRLYLAGLKAFKKEAQPRIHNDKEADALAVFLEQRGSPKDAGAQCAALQAEAGKKYKFRVGDKIEIPDSWISNMLGNIGNFVSVGNVIMKSAPESIGMAWFAVSLALKAIQNNFALYTLFGTGLTDTTEMLIIITHYDLVYDQRQEQSSEPASDILEKLFRDIIEAYSAILDFSFSIHRHLSGSGWAKVVHGVKDFFGSEGTKFQAKLDRVSVAKAKVLEASQGAFQDQVFQNFNHVNSSLEDLKDSITAVQNREQQAQHWLEEQLAQQFELLQDIKISTKPRSRWDWALQQFDECRKLLDPLDRTDEPLFKHLDDKIEGTCEWILRRDEYNRWLTSTTHEVLCLTGHAGYGKSVLLASLLVQLETSARDEEGIIIYYSCAMDNRGQSDEDSPVNFNKLRNTLIFKLLQLAAIDDTNPALLEACNEVLLRKKPQKSSKSSKTETSLPSLCEVLVSLSHLLGRPVFLLVDAVDRMSDMDQQLFGTELRNLLDQSGPYSENVHFLLSCRPKSPLAQEFGNLDIVADVSGSGFSTDLDIQYVLDLNLQPLSGWSSAQKVEAKGQVVKQAGHLFSYITQVAIPFLLEPYQSSFDERMLELPKGIAQTYSQAANALAPNYRSLLQTALSFALFSPRPPTVSEIIESYNGTYTSPSDLESDDAFKHYAPEEARRHIKQIRDAAGPFLEVVKDDEHADMIVLLSDADQIKDFCLQSDEKTGCDADELVCQHCGRAKDAVPMHFSFSAKHGHLDLAIRCLQHLCSSRFQKRFPLSNNPTQFDWEATPTPFTYEWYLANENNDASDDSDSDDSDSDDSEDDSEWDDESVDNEDRPEPLFRAVNVSVDSGEDLLGRSRYEVQYMAYHIRQAQQHWSSEERLTDTKWQMLFGLLDQFCTTSGSYYFDWQNLVLFEREMSKPGTPLYAAAALSLVSWAEHLLSQDQRWPGLTFYGETLLYTAAHAASDTDMLRLLLQHGADLNEESTAGRPSLEMLWRAPTKENVQLLLEFGADLSVREKYCDDMTMLHVFAVRGSDVEAFNLLCQGNATKVDINARDKDGATPIHQLLMQRDVPLPLLAAFLQYGADVNAEDNHSQRVLQLTSGWGDEHIVKLLLPKVSDIDDPDANGRTALHVASWYARTRCVELLLQHGAALVRRDHHERSPFWFACSGSFPDSQNTAKMLLKMMLETNIPIAEINRPTIRGRTPLRQAADNGFTDIVRELLTLIEASGSDEAKSLINKADDFKKRTALHCAASKGRTECVKLLLDHGADHTMIDCNDNTALRISQAQWRLSGDTRYEETIALLVMKHPSAAKNDIDLLFIAAANGSLKILHMLHDLDASFNRHDAYGWTPLMLAEHHKKLEAAELIRNACSLPTRWVNPQQHVQASEDGLKLTVLRLESPSITPATISSDVPLPANVKEFYFEVTTTSLASSTQARTSADFPNIAIGFCTHGASALRYPGWPPRRNAQSVLSWALHCDDGALGSSDGEMPKNKARRCPYGATIGCGVDFEKNEIFFTCDGNMIPGAVLTGVSGRLFPVVGIWTDEIRLETKFAAPFRWTREVIRQ